MSNNYYYGQPNQTQGYQDQNQYYYDNQPYQQDQYQGQYAGQYQDQYQNQYPNQYQQQDQGYGGQNYDYGTQQQYSAQPAQFNPLASSGLKLIGKALSNRTNRAPAQQSYASNNDGYDYQQQGWSAQGYAPQVQQIQQSAKSGYGFGGQDDQDGEELILSSKPKFIQMINSNDPYNQNMIENVFGGDDINLDDFVDLDYHSDGYCSSEEVSDEEPVPENWDEKENEIKASRLVEQYGEEIPINAKTKKIVSAHVPNNDEVTQCIFDLVPDEIVQKNMQPPPIRQRLGNQKFVDNEFTLDNNKRDSQKYRVVDPDIIQWRDYSWKNLKDIEQSTRQKFKIYDDNILPNDVVQGELGSCFFLSAISALAERPALVRRLFEGPQLHPSGCQGVWLNNVGVWKQIAIDDFYPTTRDGRFAFASGRDGKLWVPMIEKAYAKSYGSYEAINGGRAEEALRDLTGSPYELFKDELKQDINKLWDKVLDADKKNYLMVCAKNNNGQGEVIEGRPEMKHPNGLVSGHAYSLIAAHEVTGSDGRQYKIVQVRNPWGNNVEWTGRFSDRDRLWTPQLKQQLKQEERADGTFWMPFEDFCREFDDIGICKVHPNFVYNSIQKKVVLDNETKTFPMLIHTRKEGTYYFSVDKENPKIHLENVEPYVRITIIKLDNDTVKWVGSTAGFERNVNVKCKINPGTYLALVDISPQQFPTKSPNRLITFSSYGEDIASLQEVKLTKKQMTHLEIMAFNLWGVKDAKAAWKRNKNPQNLGRFNLFTDVLEEKDAGMTMQRIMPSDPNAPLNMTLNVQVQNQAACDGSRDAETFKVDLGNTGIFYGKVNDQSVQISAGFKSGQAGAPDTSYLNIVRPLLTNFKPSYPNNTKTGVVSEKPQPSAPQPAPTPAPQPAPTPAPGPTPAKPTNNFPTDDLMNKFGQYAQTGGYNNNQPVQPVQPAKPQPAPTNNTWDQQSDDWNQPTSGNQGWGQQNQTTNWWDQPSQDQGHNQWGQQHDDPYSGYGGYSQGGFGGRGGHGLGGRGGGQGNGGHGGRGQNRWDAFQDDDFGRWGNQNYSGGWGEQPSNNQWGQPTSNQWSSTTTSYSNDGGNTWNTQTTNNGKPGSGGFKWW
jgi:hypothetical protein